MWQVNGFDRRCFQLGRGFRLVAVDLPGGLALPESTPQELRALIASGEQQLAEGSVEAALEAARRAVAAATSEAKAAALRLKVRVQCWRARRTLDGGPILREAEEEIEAEAAQFHKAKCSRGVAWMRLSLAEIDLQRGGLCRCGSAADLALEALEELPEAQQEAKLLHAAALLGSGRPAEAEAAELLQRSRSSGERRWEAAALHISALSKALQGTRTAYEEALRCLSDAQNIYRDLQLWSCHYAVELHMARLYLESERPHEAASIAEEALVLIQDLGDLHSEYLAYGLLCCAILDDESTGDRRLRAEGRAKEAVERFKIQGKRPHALALSLLAGVLGETSSTLEARTKVEEALRLSRDLEDMDLEAHLLLRLSSLLASENDDETLKALEGVIALCQRLPEKAELIASARYLSVSLLLRMFDPMDSLREASQARAFFAEEKDLYREALTLVAIASVCFSRKDLSEAKESLALARELFRDASDPRGEVLALSTLAEMHQAENEIPEALEVLQRARAVAQEAGWKEEEVRLLVEIANLQRAENVKLSARTAREGLRIAKHAKMLEGQVQLLMQCVQCNLILASSSCSRNLWEETRRLADDAVMLTSGISAGWRRRLHGLALYWQAHSVALKDPSEALQSLEALVKICRDTQNLGLEAHVQLLEAQIQLPNDKGKAVELLRPAMATFKKLGDLNGSQMAEEVLQRATAVPVARPVEPTSTSDVAALTGMPEQVVSKKLERHSVRSLIMDLAKDAVASEDQLFDDSVLMDMGMDSLTSVAFRNDLSNRFQLDLPASLIFEYPSVGELTKLVVSMSEQ